MYAFTETSLRLLGTSSLNKKDIEDQKRYQISPNKWKYLQK